VFTQNGMLLACLELPNSFLVGVAAAIYGVEGNFSVPLWSKLEFCSCTCNWTKFKYDSRML
jgi:hypothetical protein